MEVMDIIDQFAPGMEHDSTKGVDMYSYLFSNFHNVFNASLCCLCGASFNAGLTKTNICVKCLSNQTDITTGITKQGILNYCRLCKRYLGPPWTSVQLESKELLTMCLKKIKGLNRVTLVDASFIWTEPHSKRIKLKLTIQKEILNKISISQTFPVEFVVHDQQCDDCRKDFTPHTWGASVQVRQKVDHKKTFFFLEQLILKHNAHDKVSNVKENHEGIDFFFKTKAHAMRLIDFLQSLFPIKCKSSKQLISQDDHNNIMNYKYVYSVEIPRICKDDLVIISSKLAGMLGGCNQILICTKVSSMIHLLDPTTLKTIEMNGQTYFQYENDMTFISPKNGTTEFMVFNVEKDKVKTQGTTTTNSSSSTLNTTMKNKFSTVTIGRTSDWQSFEVKTNLGDILNEGSMVLGYDMTSLNINGTVEDPKILANTPDVILIKKIYPDRKKNKKRIWKLKHLDKEEEKANNIHKNAAQQKEKDYEEFLDDLEEDPELRSHVNLYRNEKAIKELQDKKMDDKDTLPKDNNNKKKVRVKGNKKGADTKDEEVIKPVEIAEKKEVINEPVKNMEVPPEIRLEELLSELTLNEKLEENVEDDKYIEDFIAKMDKIKIEKQGIFIIDPCELFCIMTSFPKKCIGNLI